MNFEEVFKPILDKDEKIIESFKPQRRRTILLSIVSRIIGSSIIFVFLGIFILIAFLMSKSDGTCMINDVEATVEECREATKFFYIAPSIMAGLVLLVLVFRIIAIVVSYNKTYFCCTNKRIIIRTGFIGADFQTLDYDLIGGMDVRVDFLDKLCHPNTGTITFASAASPMVQKTSSYHFSFIENPYEVYRRVKEYCSSNKDGKLNS